MAQEENLNYWRKDEILNIKNNLKAKATVIKQHFDCVLWMETFM